MPKTVLESKFVELEGLDRISAKIHEMKCLWREISKDDVGIDGEIEVLTPKEDGKGYQVTGGIIKVQAKSGLSYIKEDKPASFSVKSNVEDFKAWYQATFPTVFIIYHPKDKKLYWKEMRSYIKNTSNAWQNPIKIVFDKTKDELGKSSAPQLQSIAEVSPPRISFNESEKVYSNLFFVRRYPHKIWSAPCDVSTRQEINEDVEGPTPPFIVKGGRLYSFYDLLRKECVLRKYCDCKKVKRYSVKDFCVDDETNRDYVTLINQLFSRHLWNIGLKYNFKFRRDYFPRENYKDTEFSRSWYNIRTKRTSHRTLVKYYEYGYEKFWRHHAANFRFRKINNNWYLQVVPKYFYTEDGTRPWDSDLIGPYTTRIKAAEKNQKNLLHVLFWSDALLGFESKEGQIRIWMEGLDTSKTIATMIIERNPLTGIANFAIPYDPATFDDSEKPQIQMSILDLCGKDDDDFDRSLEGGDDDY